MVENRKVPEGGLAQGAPSALAHAQFMEELSALRPKLMSFARLQLRDSHSAEDVVQEAILAAMEQAHQFSERSSLRTWVTAILRNKISDQFRRRRRFVQLDDDDSSDDLAAFEDLFDERGRFRETPASWTSNPEATLSQKQFFEVLEICVEKLPAQAARVFLMREWLELPTDEICHELGISTSNCWVTLYRARMRLRACLELNWFQEGREASNGSKNS